MCVCVCICAIVKSCARPILLYNVLAYRSAADVDVDVFVHKIPNKDIYLLRIEHEH